MALTPIYIFVFFNIKLVIGIISFHFCCIIITNFKLWSAIRQALKLSVGSFFNGDVDKDLIQLIGLYLFG